MANEEHVAQLWQGAASWNAWREENADIRPDLSGADLSGAFLLDANLAEANLVEANLSRAKLLKANLGPSNYRTAGDGN
jgi:uncharacterized protein YjbI with pentapeptide repeats